MGFKLELPDIGEGVVEAEVQQWFVAPGDAVAEDQPLVEVMTDKATVVIPSPKRGRVTQLFWKVGDVARVHAPLLELELDQGAPPPTPGSPDRAAVAKAASAAATTSPSPVGASVPAPTAGDGQGDGHGDLRAAERAGAKALATPAVRALARELGIDVNAVGGTGKGGRVTKEDLAAARERTNGHAHPAPAPAAPAAAPPGAAPAARPLPAIAPAPAIGPAGEDERLPLRGLRKRIAENMARSKRTAAHFTFVEEADVSELVRVKDRIAKAAQAEGVKVTFLPFVVKAVVAALRKHPILNASLDDERGEIVVHHRHDIGIAAATEGGLTVPVVRGADRRSLLDLAREIERLAQDAKAGRSRPEDVGRSTFTITSLGAQGGLFATPVLNHPEVGILGLHRIRPTPVVRDGQIVVREVMNVSLTSDHRVVDGHVAAAFAYQVIAYLEDPNLLFMQLV